jgi:hypothetical protein
MTVALVFIASCLIGAFLIELHARYRMNRLMALRVEALNLTHDSDRGEHSTEQSTSDNRKQNNIHLGASPTQY